MKKLLISTLITTLAATSLSAITYEHQQFFKDPTTMGMGGANVAIGGKSTALFYNPAGLSKIPKEYGWEFSLLNAQLGLNDKIQDVAQTFIDANDESKDKGTAAQTEAMLGAANKNFGKVIQFEASEYSSVGKKFEKVAFALGAFGGFGLDGQVHRGFGSDGILELAFKFYGGFAAGMSYDVKELTIGNVILNNFSVGGGFKYVLADGYRRNVGLSEIIDPNFGATIQNEVDEKSKSLAATTVFDLGAIYDFSPRFFGAVSMMNLGVRKSPVITVHITLPTLIAD